MHRDALLEVGKCAIGIYDDQASSWRGHQEPVSEWLDGAALVGEFFKPDIQGLNLVEVGRYFLGNR